VSREKDLMRAALVVTFVVAADQLSKAWAQASLPLNQRVSVIDGWFGFGLTKNSGATFSLLRGQNGLFELVTAALLLLIVAVLVRGKAPDRLTLVALASILGGGHRATYSIGSDSPE
jgi:signal peptidase II